FKHKRPIAWKMASSEPGQLLAGLNAFNSIVKPLKPDDSESPLNTDPTGSSGDSTSIISDLDDTNWEQVLGWDWNQVSKDVLDSTSWKNSKRDVGTKVHSPLRPPPEKDEYNGLFSYVEYIPAWTSPKFDPQEEYFGTEGENEVAYQRWQSSYWSRLRPAQALGDSFYNPTAMAKRYGVHPDRKDGRSRLSPIDSVSRKIQLDKPISMPDGTSKSFVDIKHYKWVQEHEYSSQENAPAVANGQSFKSFLVERSKASDNTRQQDSSEVYEKLLLLHKQVLDDQEYQRAFFNEFTTDELFTQRVFHFEDDAKYELQGHLHPLVRQEKWLTTEDRGDDLDMPKLLWSFGGNRGEWSAHDPTVWAALQPALQVLTRFLCLDAPAFTSMMDYRSQRPFEQQVGNTIGKRQRIAWFAEVDPDKTWPCLARLHDLGFNSVEWVQIILEERLELVVGSAYRDQHGRCGSSHFAWTNLVGQVNLYLPEYPGAKGLGSQWRIRIEVAAEGIWPLLSPHFTEAEKSTCSFALAVTMFHEFAHAINYALEIMRTWPDVFSRKEGDFTSRITREQHLELLIAKQEMPEYGSEPFFENQTEAEAGFALESQIFGGTVYPIFHGSTGNTPDNFGIFTTALALTGWPTSRPVELNNLPIDFLPDFTPPVLDFYIPLPYDVTARFFTRNFWDTDYKRFGPDALQLYPEGRISMGAVPHMRMQMVYALQAVFGKRRAKWMTRALRELNNRGFDTIANYINEVCRKYALPKITRRNWYLESGRWPLEVARVEDCLDGLRLTGNSFLLAFAKMTEDEALRIEDVRNLVSRAQQSVTAPDVTFEACLEHYVEQLTRTTDKTFSVLLAWLKALERVMAMRLQQSQFLVRSYLQLDTDDRCTINEGRGKRLRRHMRVMITRPYNKVKMCLVATVNFIQSRLDPEAAKKYVEQLERPYGHLRAIFQMTKETINYLKPANENLNVGGVGVSFAYLPSSTFDPEARAERLKPIVMADLKFVKSEEIQEIVRVFETIFRWQDGKEILPRDQATLDEKLAEVNDLLARGVVDDGQPEPPGDPRSGPGRGQRGPAKVSNSGPKTAGSSRVTKKKKTTTKKLQATVSRLFNQDPAGMSNRISHTFQRSTPLRAAPISTGSAQASSQFTQYASASTSMTGFPTHPPGQRPAFAAPTPSNNNSAGPAEEERQPQPPSRSWLFPHPFADQTTLNQDLTPSQRNWGAELAQAKLPNDMRSYRGQVAEMLECDNYSGASALMAMASLGPPSQDSGPDNSPQAQAVHEAVAQAVSAAMPNTGDAGPANLSSAAASMRPVQLLTATWAAAWTPGGAGSGAGAAAGVNALDQLAEYATRRMVNQGSQSQSPSTGQGGVGAGAAPNPQAGEVPGWTQLSTVDEIMGAVMDANDFDAMDTDGED
ncbi:hypothetical protein PspLS_06347, partial [Pyricularia sp. CBS 133598]